MPRYASRLFTDRFLTSLRPQPKGVIQLTDAAARGLTIRVTPEGTRTWAIRYSVRGKGQRKATLGRYPAITLLEARRKAQEIANAARVGRDLPAEEANQRAADEVRGGKPKTVEDLIRRYVEDHAKGRLRRWKMVEQALKNHVIDPALEDRNAPQLGRMLLVDIRRAHVIELLDYLLNEKKLTAQVNAVRAHLSAVFSWGLDREFIGNNPAASVRKTKGLSRPRERVLADNELRALWKGCVELGYPGGHAIRTLILTGQRRNEVCCLPNTELSEEGNWLLPGDRNKSGRDHLLPLPRMARELIAESFTLGGGKLAFTQNGERPYQSMGAFKKRLVKCTGVTDWRIHDIRRTVRTRLAEMGVPSEVARAILNHARPGLDRVYDQGNYRDAMLAALEAWAARVHRIVNAEPVLTATT